MASGNIATTNSCRRAKGDGMLLLTKGCMVGVVAQYGNTGLFPIRKSIWGVYPPSQIKVYLRVLRFNLPYNITWHCGTPALQRKIYSNLLYSCIFQPTESHPMTASTWLFWETLSGLSLMPLDSNGLGTGASLHSGSEHVRSMDWVNGAPEQDIEGIASVAFGGILILILMGIFAQQVYQPSPFKSNESFIHVPTGFQRLTIGKFISYLCTLFSFHSLNFLLITNLDAPRVHGPETCHTPSTCSKGYGVCMGTKSPHCTHTYRTCLQKPVVLPIPMWNSSSLLNGSIACMLTFINFGNDIPTRMHDYLWPDPWVLTEYSLRKLLRSENYINTMVCWFRDWVQVCSPCTDHLTLAIKGIHNLIISRCSSVIEAAKSVLCEIIPLGIV